MRNLNLVLTVCIVLFLANNSYASISILPAENGVYSLKAEDIKDLSLKEIETKLGHKLGWKQKLAIQLVKHKLIKAEVLTEKPIPSGLSLVLGLILGWFLPLIGVAFAYLVFPKDKNLIKGAWIGSILVLVFSFIYLLALFSSWN